MIGAVGIVLAGGRSSRLGGDALGPGGKAAVEFNGRSLLERVVTAVAPEVDRVVVVAAPGQPLPAVPAGVVIVRDSAPGSGPLAALGDGLRVAAGFAPPPRVAFVATCDVPLLRPAVVRLLVGRSLATGAGWVVPEWDGHPQVLLSVVALDLLPAIEVRLAAGGRDLRGLLEAESPARVERVTAAALAAVDRRGDFATDVDTPEDLARLADRGIPPSAP
ncbi:MAG: molybdenum cofactor guanylyltransferase [Planctomycetia bacterium]